MHDVDVTEEQSLEGFVGVVKEGLLTSSSRIGWGRPKPTYSGWFSVTVFRIVLSMRALSS